MSKTKDGNPGQSRERQLRQPGQQVQRTQEQPAAEPNALAPPPAPQSPADPSKQEAAPRPASPQPVPAAPAVPPLTKFRLRTPDGEDHDFEAANVQDAIRMLNGDGSKKVYAYKQLVVTELSK